MVHLLKVTPKVDTLLKAGAQSIIGRRYQLIESPRLRPQWERKAESPQVAALIIDP